MAFDHLKQNLVAVSKSPAVVTYCVGTSLINCRYVHIHGAQA